MNRRHHVSMVQAGVSDVNGNVREVAHRVEERIDHGTVRTSVRGLGHEQIVPEVTSTHPAVAGYLIQLDQSRRAAQHADRAIVPQFKELASELSDQPLAACPQCATDEQISFCDLCEGTGAVLETVAAAWFIDHDLSLDDFYAE